MPRIARKKMVGKGCYYHLCNRLSGKIGEFPLTDVDKEKGFKLIEELSDLFLIEVISLCWMGNHFHLVCFAPGEPPSPEDAASRHNAYYGEKRIELNPSVNLDKCKEAADGMIDVSRFVGMFQQRYTRYVNRAHRRRGSLWGDRFKSTILEGSRESLWNCVKYVELNPVRANMVDDPSDYRFCSWGRYCGSGTHPFAKSFAKHMRAVAESHSGVELSDAEVFAEFRGELARIQAAERGETSEEIHEATEAARTKGDSMPVRFLRRTRHWTDGAIIGGKAFVQEVGCRFESPENHERVMKKRLSRGDVPGGVLYCFKRLRCALE